jgi:voltage-gated potassium channel
MFSGPVRRVLIGLCTFITICILAVIGFVHGGFSLGDAVYMVVITVFGVGFGEVQPVQTPFLRTHTMLVIIFGYGAAVYTVGGFIQMLVDGELHNALRERSMSNGIANLREHTIICGYGRIGSMLARELLTSGKPLVVVDEDVNKVELAHQDGLLAMVGNATEETILKTAGIDHAKTIATMLPIDASNAFICVTARALNRSVEVISRGEAPSAEKKLRMCGADHVVMMPSIAAKRAAHLIIRPTAASVLQSHGLTDSVSEDLGVIGLAMEELRIDVGTVLEGKPLDSINVKGNSGFLVVGIRSESGSVLMNPPPTTILRSGDVVIVLGHKNDIPAIGALCRLKQAKLPYRGASH